MNIENSIFRIFRKFQMAIIPKVIELEQKNLTHMFNSSQATIVPNFIQIRVMKVLSAGDLSWNASILSFENNKTEMKCNLYKLKKLVLII